MEILYEDYEADHPDWGTKGGPFYTYARVEKATNMVFDLSDSDDEALGAIPPLKIMYLTVIHPDGSLGQKFTKHEFNHMYFDDLKELSDEPFLELRISIEDNNETNSTSSSE